MSGSSAPPDRLVGEDPTQSDESRIRWGEEQSGRGAAVAASARRAHIPNTRHGLGRDLPWFIGHLAVPQGFRSHVVRASASLVGEAELSTDRLVGSSGCRPEQEPRSGRPRRCRRLFCSPTYSLGPASRRFEYRSRTRSGSAFMTIRLELRKLEIRGASLPSAVVAFPSARSLTTTLQALRTGACSSFARNGRSAWPNYGHIARPKLAGNC